MPPPAQNYSSLPPSSFAGQELVGTNLIVSGFTSSGCREFGKTLGCLDLQNRMNFWKTSKSALTTPHHLSLETYIAEFVSQKIHPKYTKIHHTNLQYNLLDRPISYIQSFYKCAPPSLPPLLLLQMLSHVCSIFRNFLVLAINPIMIAPIRRPATIR